VRYLHQFDRVRNTVEVFRTATPWNLFSQTGTYALMTTGPHVGKFIKSSCAVILSWPAVMWRMALAQNCVLSRSLEMTNKVNELMCSRACVQT
jgi:hypothetical protein